MATNPFEQPGLKDSLYARAFSALRDDSQYGAAQGTFDESKGTAGRVNQITSSASPLMTAARTRAKQASASRGLLNSSIAGQAGEQAVIETATPIAANDAGLYQQQQLENQRSQNQAFGQNAQARTNIGLAGINAAEQGRQYDTTLGFEKDKFGKSLMENARQFDTNLGENRRQFDTSQTLTRDMFASDDAFRKAQAAQQESQFGRTQTLTREQFASDDAFRKAQAAQQAGQFGQTLEQDKARLAETGRQFDAGQTLTREQFSSDEAFRRAQAAQQESQFGRGLTQEQARLAETGRQFDSSQTANLRMFDQELAQKAEQFGISEANRLTLANLDVNSRLDLANIEAKWRNDIQSSSNISNAWGSMMNNIASIQNNPDLEQAAKATLIQNTQDSFAAFAGFWKKASGGTVDVSDLLRFGPQGGADQTVNTGPVMRSPEGGGSGGGYGGGYVDNSQ